jgi:polysaccharide export outer membrane protein
MPLSMLFRRPDARLCILAASLSLAGCYALPSAGPLVSDIEQENQLRPRYPFQLVTLDPEMVPILQADGPAEDAAFIADLGVADLRVGPGDVLSVTIVEPGGGGLFTGTPGSGEGGGEPGARVVTLPETTVDAAGRITVPFAGTSQVSGRTTTEIAALLRAALGANAVQPQVMVNLNRSRANRITVAGAVKSPGVFELTEPGVTLLEAVAMAGGTPDAPQDTVVQLHRFGAVHRVRLLTLLDTPAANIHLQGGDYVHLLVQPRSYVVLGAAGKAQEAPLPAAPLTLSAAIGRAGGLVDNRADSRGVFLFRYENRATMERLAAVSAKLARRHGEEGGEVEPPPGDAPAPVIYRLNLMSGSGLFLAQQVTLRENDLIYVPGAEALQWKKLVDLLPVLGSGSIYNSVQ